jgi:propionate CoA-transferase
MDEAIFQPQPMGLREAMLRLPLEQRFAFDAEQNLFFANFEGITVRSAADIDDLRVALEQRLSDLGRKACAGGL